MGGIAAALARRYAHGYSPITLDHVFDSRTIDEVIVPAKQFGYRVRQWVVCPNDPEVCVERVRKRREEGGHGRSAWAVRELYESALHVASELSTLSDETRLIDSSSRSGFEFVGDIRDFNLIIKSEPIPVWVTDHFLSSAQAGVDNLGPRMMAVGRRTGSDNYE